MLGGQPQFQKKNFLQYSRNDKRVKFIRSQESEAELGDLRNVRSDYMLQKQRLSEIPIEFKSFPNDVQTRLSTNPRAPSG